MSTLRLFSYFLVLTSFFTSCKETEKPLTPEEIVLKQKINQYEVVKLTTDTALLSQSEKSVLPHLIMAADIMDELFWRETYGNKDSLLSQTKFELEKQFCLYNYGPWDRLNDNLPFMNQYGAKPKGANFYPKNSSKTEIEKLKDSSFLSPYSFIRRNEFGQLYTVPYSSIFKSELTEAADHLLKAASKTEDHEFAEYLRLRAEALLTDNYLPSTDAWLDLTTNKLDIIIGSINNYEDRFLGIKKTHVGLVLLKDQEWSQRLSYYIRFLPEIQSNLNVPEIYKQEKPSMNAQLGAYDLLYCSGSVNAGSKPISVHYPELEMTPKGKGSRKAFLKNVIKEKFHNILLPIAAKVLDEQQLALVNYEAFIACSIFHEISHGIGLQNTIRDNLTVKAALKELHSPIEEGKADILSVWIIKYLYDKNVISGDINEYYATYIASLFRSIRFGRASMNGNTNLLRFNYFLEKGALSYTDRGKYHINFEKLSEAIDELSTEILMIQGDGNYDKAKLEVIRYGNIPNDLENVLLEIEKQQIPVDLHFDQGLDVLGI